MIERKIFACGGENVAFWPYYPLQEVLIFKLWKLYYSVYNLNDNNILWMLGIKFLYKLYNPFKECNIVIAYPYQLPKVIPSLTKVWVYHSYLQYTLWTFVFLSVMTFFV